MPLWQISPGTVQADASPHAHCPCAVQVFPFTHPGPQLPPQPSGPQVLPSQAGTHWQAPLWQVIGCPKLAQQLRSSVQDCASFLQRQRPFFVSQKPVQHCPSRLHSLALPPPLPHGPWVEISPRRFS